MLQETNVENLKRPFGEFADAHAKYLEDIGFRKNLDKVIRPLLNVFDKVRVSVDGDCTYNKILETENTKVNPDREYVINLITKKDRSLSIKSIRYDKSQNRQDSNEIRASKERKERSSTSTTCNINNG